MTLAGCGLWVHSTSWAASTCAAASGAEVLDDFDQAARPGVYWSRDTWSGSSRRIWRCSAPPSQCIPCKPLPAGTWRSRSRRRLLSQRPRPLCLFISTADIATPRRVNSPMLLSQREAQRVTVSGIFAAGGGLGAAGHGAARPERNMAHQEFYVGPPE